MISNNIIQVRNDLIWSPSQSTAKVSLKTQDGIQLHISFLLTYFILNKLDGIFFFLLWTSQFFLYLLFSSLFPQQSLRNISLLHYLFTCSLALRSVFPHDLDSSYIFLFSSIFVVAAIKWNWCMISTFMLIGNGLRMYTYFFGTVCTLKRQGFFKQLFTFIQAIWIRCN